MIPAAPRSRGALLALAAGVALWLAATAGWRGFALPDEGRYVGIAWEMLRSGDWLVPTLGGQPFFHKPPLFYWITAAALSVGGLHPFAGRIASLAGALLIALALHAFAQRWGGVARARAALFVLVTLPLFYGAAQYANLDMLVAGCIGASVLAFAQAVLQRARGEPARAALVAAYVAAALGVLAKGLIGIVLPVIVIGLWTLWREPRGALRTWRALLAWPGPLVFLLLALPWFWLMHQRFDGFFEYFFIVQHVHRFAAGGFNNVQPFWFYAAVVPLLCLPWTPWAWGWRRAAFWTDPAQGDTRRLMAIWAAVVLLFFSWPQSKLVGYVLPACAPLAYLLADAMLDAVTRARPLVRRLAWASAGLALVMCIVAVAVAGQKQTAGHAAMAQTLRQQRAADEPIVFLERYPFDLPMLAGIDDALLVLDDWRSPSIAAADDWRREIADGARFASPQAAARLVDRRDLGTRLCGARAAWVVAPRASPPGALAPLTPRATAPQAALWRLDGDALDRFRGPCPRTPNDAPTGK